jgi:hypothetical protein
MINEVYENGEIEEGDTIMVEGYYTNPETALLLINYGDVLKNQVMPMHSFLRLYGTQPPAEAWNGGYIFVHGIVHFQQNLLPYYPGDTVTAYINVLESFVFMDGQGAGGSNDNRQNYQDNRIQNNNTDACDSCKFAVLISGGVNFDNNHARYWESLVALYQHKVDNENYCPSNVLVHYYHGKDSIPKLPDGSVDNRIPHDQVKKADTTNISSTFNEISKRVAACTKAHKKATFQKMVFNHGDTTGDICLLGNSVLKVNDLRKMQQNIIDSCCSKVQDEFLQCFAGFGVDEMSENLDSKNKATIYINSSADTTSSWSPGGATVDTYLAAKIASLAAGDDYPDAVVKAKLAYDNFLKDLVEKSHQRAQQWREKIPWHWYPIGGGWHRKWSPQEIEDKIKEAKKDSTDQAKGICHSRNVTVTPFTEYCESVKYVVPPGGRLELKFKGDKKNCGNVSVYKESKDNKIGEWNWNVPGSQGHQNGFEKRVINGDSAATTTFLVHNDDGVHTVTASVIGSSIADSLQSDFNSIDYVGASFGSNDGSSIEFSYETSPEVWIDYLDQTPFSTLELPAILGPDNTMFLGGTFTVNSEDIFASEMELHLDIAEVFQPGLLLIGNSGTLGDIELDILEPGKYEIPLGDFRSGGDLASISMNTAGVIFSFDCWGVHSVYEPIIPEVFAGIDATVFDGAPYSLADATASNFTDLLWTTSGDGVFDDPMIPNPVYMPGPSDINTGTVELCLTASPVPPWPNPETDCMQLTILPGGIGNPIVWAGDWINPEPWHGWLNGLNETTKVFLDVTNPANNIEAVSFYYKTDVTADWVYFDTDYDGRAGLAPGPLPPGSETHDGWCGYLDNSLLPAGQNLMIDFKAEMILIDGTVYESPPSILYTFDITPPSSVSLNIYDYYTTDEDHLTLEITPIEANIEFCEIEREDVDEYFAKGIPPLEQPGDNDCGPTALAACFTYFSTHGFPNLTGGLTSSQLIDSLKIYCKTNDTSGTYDDDLAAGARRWADEHIVNESDSLTVRRCTDFNWVTMREELQRCQDIISLFQWVENGDTVGHFMTFNSVSNDPDQGNEVAVDYMDPASGQIINGTMNTETGEVSGFDYPPNGARVISNVIICPKDSTALLETETVVEGPNPAPVDIPLPTTGVHRIRTRVHDEDGNTETIAVPVRRVEHATAPPDIIVERFEPPFPLTGGIPTGGTYTGPGVDNDIFYPLIAGDGIHVITYVFTYPNGFETSDTFTITVVSYDWGDAPDTYKTLAANDGARHQTGAGLYLGDLIDAEGDGQPTVNADGDDLNNYDDEDGVVFGTPLVAGNAAGIQVKASMDGILNAWLDINGNGTWADAGEHILNDVALASGWNNLTFNIPANASAGYTYMRFRFNSSGGLDYFGTAENGEVEDYKVSLFPEGWGFVSTPENHLVTVPWDITLTGITLSANDVVGVFYDDGYGNMICGGAVIYDGVNNQVVIAFGDDGTTTEKDGFADGETLNWKIYNTGTGREQWVDVEYDPNLPNHDGVFVNGGLSALTAMSNCQELTMLQGWSGISSYITPEDPDVEEVFGFDELIILYNFDGYYWPPSTNTLGDWDDHSGYVVKVSDNVILDVCGYDVSDKTVQLDAAWNIIPVLSKTDVDAATLLGATSGFGVAKEVAGFGVLWPAYGINTLVELQSGKSYFVYMNTPGTIDYGTSGATKDQVKPFVPPKDLPWNSVHQTPATHVIAFTSNAVAGFETGDIIGAFTSTGMCAGIAGVEEKDSGLGLIINGDDIYTAQTDGFVSGESIGYKLYRPSTGQTFDLEVAYESSLDNTGLFHANGLSAVTSVTITGISNPSGLNNSGIRIYPNPSAGIFNVTGIKGLADIVVYNSFGEEVLLKEMTLPGKFDLTGQPNGIYIIRISSEKTIYFDKLIIR